MSDWKFADGSGSVVGRTLANGGYESKLATCADVQAWVADGNVIAPYVPPLRTSAALKAEVKTIRAESLEWFTKNSGVAAVYQVNYEAAMLGATDNATILPSGETPKARLTALGQYIGMTAAQFAAYIIAENRGASPYTGAGIKMAEIEQEYMRVYYSIPTLSQADVDIYQAYCRARTA